MTILFQYGNNKEKMKIIKYYLGFYKKHGMRMGLLSIVCLVMFFLAIIPADAVLPKGFFDFAQKGVGGVQPGRSDMDMAYNASIPHNAAGERLVYVGDFRVTHYCACTICTWGSGITASGKPVAEGMIASDWSVLPRGTKVYVKRRDTLIETVVEDTGGAIKGNKIDIYVPSHEQALRLGVYTAELYVDPGTVLP